MAAGLGKRGIELEGVRAVRADNVGGVACGVIHHGEVDLRVLAEYGAGANNAEVAGTGDFAFEGGGLEAGGDGFGHGCFLAWLVPDGKC